MKETLILSSSSRLRRLSRVRTSVVLLLLALGIGAVSGCTDESQNQVRSDGLSSWEITTHLANWVPRRYAAAVIFLDRMWLLGGSFKGGYRTNEIWSSVDGETWIQETAHADWSPRSSHGAVVHKGAIWVVGGYGPGFTGLFLRDVWFSPDGVHWSQVTDSAPWSARRYHGVVSFRGRIWVLGGLSAEGELNDVWSTSNGRDWKLELENAPWSQRTAHATVVHDGRMWVLGGDEDSDPDAVVTRNDVWFTEDGTNWVQATEEAPWESRRTHTAVSYEGRIWLMGGRASGSRDRFFNDVWSSADGTKWVQETAAAPWAVRRPRSGR